MIQRKSLGCGTISVFLCALGLFAIGYLLWEIRSSIIRQTGAQPVKIESRRFYVVVFPKNDVKETNPVQRAVLLSLEDLAKDQVEVFFDSKSASMNTTLFTPLPSDDKEAHHIDGLNREIRRWGADADWRRVEYFINRNGYGGESVVKLTVYSKRSDRLEYLYRVTTDERVIPIWMLHYNRI